MAGAAEVRSLRDGSHEVNFASDTNRGREVWRIMPFARGDWQCMQKRRIGERSILPVHKPPLVFTFANCVFRQKHTALTVRARRIVRGGNGLYPYRILR